MVHSEGKSGGQTTFSLSGEISFHDSRRVPGDGSFKRVRCTLVPIDAVVVRQEIPSPFRAAEIGSVVKTGSSRARVRQVVSLLLLLHTA